MSKLDLLAALVAEHQLRENELRRLQNEVALADHVMFAGVVDTSWSDLAEPTDSLEARTPHFGAIPVSSLAPSNWVLGDDLPFITVPGTGAAMAPNQASDDIRRGWMTFRATTADGFLVVHPDGERVFTRWEDEGCLPSGQIFFRAFPGLMQALAWARDQAAARIRPSI